MIDNNLIKQSLIDSNLTLRSQYSHYEHLWAGLQQHLTDENLDLFCPLLFVWGLLPESSRLLVFSAAQQTHSDVFEGITVFTPLYNYSPRQQELLLDTIEKLLQTTVSFFSDWHFTQAFYPPYREQRKKVLAEQQLEAFV